MASAAEQSNLVSLRKTSIHESPKVINGVKNVVNVLRVMKFAIRDSKEVLPVDEASHIVDRSVHEELVRSVVSFNGGRAVVQNVHEKPSKLVDFVASDFKLAAEGADDFEKFAVSDFDCSISPWRELDRKLTRKTKKSGDLGK